MITRTWIILLLISTSYHVIAGLQDLTTYKQKFEYKHSFKGPNLVNVNGDIPFWQYGGNAIPSWDQVRVCPSIHSRQGWVLNKLKFAHKDWMVDIKLRISGRMKTGADGMAIWFTEEKAEGGPTFGGPENWKGLGVFLDSFDNDGQQDNPKIQIVMNDGSLNYNHHVDGVGQDQLSCLKEFRNRPHAVRLRIIRAKGTLEVWVHEGLSQRDEDYDLCGMISSTASIPSEGYFGISAATGGLSDDHDVLSFVVHSLASLDEAKTPEDFNEEQSKEYQQKYEQYAEELVKKRGTATPQSTTDHINVYQDSFEQEYHYEADWEKNLRQVLETQADMNRMLRILEQKTEQIINTLLVNNNKPIPGGAPAGGGAVPAGIKEELTAFKNTQSLVKHQLEDLRQYLEQNQGKGGGGVITSEALQPIYELKHVAERSSKSSEEVLTKLSMLTQASSCPPPPPCQSCVTIFPIILLACGQVMVVFLYNWFRQKQETAAKKFF